MKFIDSIADKIDDRINPIVVKELRQAVQSRFVVGILMLFLVSLLGITAFIALIRMVETTITVNTCTYLGRDIFEFLFYALMASSIFCVPFYTGTRMFLERSETFPDLVFISSIKPSAIIRGKLFAGIIITLLLFSVCMPFMTFTYLLRGVDIIYIFVIMAIVFIATVTSVQFTLFIGSIPCSRLFKLILSSLSILAVIFFSFIIIVIEHMCRARLSRLLDEAVIFLFLTGVSTVFFYVSAVAAISPSSSNRALSIRLCLSFTWLVLGIMSFTVRNFGIEGWIVSYIIILGLGLLISISEKDEQSLRVARTIPHGKIKRTAAFFFYSGSANGIAWILVMTGFTCYVVLLVHNCADSIPYLHKVYRVTNLQQIAGIYLYIYCYAISGLLVRRKYLCERIQPDRTWVIALIVCALSSITPYIIVLLTVRQFDSMRYILLFGSLFDIDCQKAEYHIIFTGSWAIMLTIVNLPWFVQQVRRFVPLAGTQLGR